MFAEDLGQIPAQGFTRIVDDLIANPRRSSADDIGGLFERLNDPAQERPAHGLYAGVPYANGSLFQEPTRIDLTTVELELLRRRAPSTGDRSSRRSSARCFRASFGHEKQWQLGAHYTHEADIQKIVTPTIVEPWTERIESCQLQGPSRAVRPAQLRRARSGVRFGELPLRRIRELRRIEATSGSARTSWQSGRPVGAGGHERLLSAAEHARDRDRAVRRRSRPGDLVDRAQAGRRGARVDERTLPLANLSGIRRGDALQVDWPEAEAIISNPPYHGSQNLRKVLEDDYAEWLKDALRRRIQGLCVYWFREPLSDAPWRSRRNGRDELDQPEPGSRRESELRR